MRAAVNRRAHFNAAHRLFRPDWSDEKNHAVFGACANPNYHGHNYELIVTVIGEIDPETGFVYDVSKLKMIIKTEIEDRFDHKNLNLDTEEFSNTIPTSENLARTIYNLLRIKIEEEYDLKIRLFETPRIFVDYPA